MIRNATLVSFALAAAAVPGWAQSAEDLKITVGKSVVVDYPADIGRISTSNPDVVDAVAVSTREVLLHAKGHGVSTVVIWAKAGQRTFYNVSVEHNLEPIRRVLKDSFPSEAIELQSARDSVVMVGRVSTQAVADKAASLVASLAKTVVNNLDVAPSPVEKQILLRVKFAEVDRNTADQLGVNIMSTGALNTPGLITTGQFAPPSVTGVGGSIPGGIPGTTTSFNFTDALNVFAFRPDLNLASTIRALQSQGLLQILAEPNLVTTNGKEASFLVGGEFPIPILQGGASAGSVSVVFREYGIRLNFNPQMTANQTLKMFVRPEVSTLDLANSVTFAGFRIPALATRRMETNIELAPGQSFVIGGLVDDRLEYTMTKVPGLSAIPVLGALFKSRLENKGKTELVVMVTPEIVDPLNPNDPKPAPSMPRQFIGPMSDIGQKAPRTTAKASRESKKKKESTPVTLEVAAATPPAEAAPTFEVALAAGSGPDANAAVTPEPPATAEQPASSDPAPGASSEPAAQRTQAGADEAPEVESKAKAPEVESQAVAPEAESQAAAPLGGSGGIPKE